MSVTQAMHEETFDEVLLGKQFGNHEDVRDRHSKRVAEMTISHAKRYRAC